MVIGVVDSCKTPGEPHATTPSKAATSSDLIFMTARNSIPTRNGMSQSRLLMTCTGKKSSNGAELKSIRRRNRDGGQGIVRHPQLDPCAHRPHGGGGRGAPRRRGGR